MPGESGTLRPARPGAGRRVGLSAATAIVLECGAAPAGSPGAGWRPVIRSGYAAASMQPIASPEVTLDDIRAAARRIAGSALVSPLVRLEVDRAPGEIWLKLENLQPIGSFKLRGASNAMLGAPPEALARGVWTASAGNMAQGVAC